MASMGHHRYHGFHSRHTISNTNSPCTHLRNHGSNSEHNVYGGSGDQHDTYYCAYSYTIRFQYHVPLFASPMQSGLASHLK